MLSLEEYLNKIGPHIRDIIYNLKNLAHRKLN